MSSNSEHNGKGMETAMQQLNMLDTCPLHILQIKDFNVRSEVFMAVNMMNGVFWDIKTLFIPHRRHFTSPLQSPAS
jgi:hypothetical protein